MFVILEDRDVIFDGDVIMIFEQIVFDFVFFFWVVLVDKEFEFEIEFVVDDENYQGVEIEFYNFKLDLENYYFFIIDLMKYYENSEFIINMEEQNVNKDCIINILCSFGIEISMIKVMVGFMVIFYEIILE